MLHAPFTNIVKLTFLTVDNPLKNCVFNFCYFLIFCKKRKRYLQFLSVYAKQCTSSVTRLKKPP